MWIWTLVVVAGIFATLGLAATLAKSLNNQALAAVLFLAGMFLVGVTVLTSGLQARPRGVEIAAGLGIAVVYGMLLFRLTIPERSHLIEYSVVAVFIFEAVTERKRNGRRVPAPALLTILLTTIIGTVDELIQLYLPSRHFDWYDILFNFLAALVAVVALLLLRYVRRLAGSVRRGAS